MKIKIIDDNLNFIHTFSSYLKVYFKDAIIDYSQDIAYDYDIYFLDIDMPDCSGIDIAKSIKLHNDDAIIIYVTYRDDLVFEALQTFPYYFLRKSNMEKELPLVVDKIKSKMLGDTIEITYQNTQISLKLVDICYIEKIGQYCNVITKNNNYKVRHTMKWFVNHLPITLFGLISQGVLVNYKYVIHEKKTYIIMKDGKEFYYSRGKRKEFIKYYLNYRT